MELPGGNPKLPDEINNAHRAPLQDALILMLGVSLVAVFVVLLVGWSARWLAPFVPYDWERRWLTSEADEAEKPSAEEAELQAVLERLLVNQQSPLPVTVHLLEDVPEPNAFATVGGHIFVTSGLLENVSSENGLAMVLAHEYGHIKARHPLIMGVHSATTGALLALVGMGEQTSQVGAKLTLLSFSREMERDADTISVQLLRDHYGHLLGADEFFRKMLKQHKDSAWKSAFQTHPMTSSRLRAFTLGARETDRLTPLPSPLQKLAKQGNE